MGSACCCLRDDYEELTNPNSSVYRNCVFLHLYSSLFHNRGELALPSTPQSTLSLTSSMSPDHSLADMYRSPPRPLPYDADPRIYQLQLSKREKGSSHSHDDTVPLRTSGVDEESDSPANKNKWNEFECEEGSKEYSSKSSFNLSKATAGYAHLYISSEEEDVCPTCLEEYTTENPRIITKCSHHYHLGCIYEWMERSDKCPVCSKVMAFDEST